MALTGSNIVWKASIDTEGVKKGADDISKNFNQISDAEKKATDGAEKYNKSVEKTAEKGKLLQRLKKNWLGVVGAITAVVMAVSKVLRAVNEYIGLAEAQLSAEKKLETILKQRTNATNAQIKSIKNLTAEQQKLGVIGDEVQIAGAQQISTFVTQTETVEKLIPAMNNLLAQTAGLNASQGDAVNIGNLMGKVLMGEVGALKRVGISFSEAEEQVLKFGTESEKAAMLAQVITNNVGNMNEELAKTDSGRIKNAKNAIGDFKEEIGKFLLPMVAGLYNIFINILNKIIEIRDEFKRITKESGITETFENLGHEINQTGKEIGITNENFDKISDKFKEFNKLAVEKTFKGIAKQAEITTKIFKVYSDVTKWIAINAKEAGANLKIWTKNQIENIKSSESWIKITTTGAEIVDKLKTKFQQLWEWLVPLRDEIANFFTPLINQARDLLKTLGMFQDQPIIRDPTQGRGIDRTKRPKTLIPLEEVIETDQVTTNQKDEPKIRGKSKKDIEGAVKVQKDLEMLMLSLMSDSIEKRIKLIEFEYKEKINLARGNADIIKDIEAQQDQAILDAKREFYKSLADAKMETFELEQEIERERFEQTILDENKRNQFILKQQIAAYNERLAIDESLTEREIELIELRQSALEQELRMLEKTGTIIAGVFAEVGKSLTQINMQSINSVEEFGKALYDVTMTNIKNYLAQTLAIAIKNSMESAGNPILGLVLAGVASLGVIALFDTIQTSIPKFESGGIIEGSSYSGDNVLARVNSGEMILNKNQQQELFNIANGKGAGVNLSLEKTNRILNEQIDILTSQKSFVFVGNKIYTINQQSGKVLEKKLI